MTGGRRGRWPHGWGDCRDYAGAGGGPVAVAGRSGHEDLAGELVGPFASKTGSAGTYVAATSYSLKMAATLEVVLSAWAKRMPTLASTWGALLGLIVDPTTVRG